MQKLSDDVLNEVVECYNEASTLEDNFFYSPDEDTFFQYVCILSRLEWMRRKLNRLGLCQDLQPLDVALDAFECGHNLEDMTPCDMNEGDVGVGAACLCCSFENLIISYSESLCWGFYTKYQHQEHFDELSEIILSKHLEATDFLKYKDDIIGEIIDGYVMIAPEIVSRVYYFITKYSIHDINADKFLQYLPKWVTRYYIDTELQCNGELIEGNYICSSVLVSPSYSWVELGYVSQYVSLPFGMMLCNHYAIVLAEKYPEILGTTKVAVYG